MTTRTTIEIEIDADWRSRLNWTWEPPPGSALPGGATIPAMFDIEEIIDAAWADADALNAAIGAHAVADRAGAWLDAMAYLSTRAGSRVDAGWLAALREVRNLVEAHRRMAARGVARAVRRLIATRRDPR